ncbi:hypothetical protein JNO12_23020 [Erwinia aphidicola]|nr:hypothetical protein [Erwinia aphidicola]
MADFVQHHRRQRIVAFRHLHQLIADNQRAVRQHKGVGPAGEMHHLQPQRRRVIFHLSGHGGVEQALHALKLPGRQLPAAKAAVL